MAPFCGVTGCAAQNATVLALAKFVLYREFWDLVFPKYIDVTNLVFGGTIKEAEKVYDKHIHVEEHEPVLGLHLRCYYQPSTTLMKTHYFVVLLCTMFMVIIVLVMFGWQWHSIQHDAKTALQMLNSTSDVLVIVSLDKPLVIRILNPGGDHVLHGMRVQAPISHVVSHGDSARLQTFISTPNGDKTIEFESPFVDAQSGRLVVFEASAGPFLGGRFAMPRRLMIMRDVLQKKIQHESLAVIERLESAKQHYITCTAHDLRTPLTVFDLCVTLLRGEQPLTPEQADILNQVRIVNCH
jgi:hypothetical protein